MPSESNFNPNGIVSRADVMEALYIFVHAMVDPNAPNLDDIATDVPENADYYEAVRWAYDVGITSGATSTTFAPGRNVRRQEAITLIANTYSFYNVMFHKTRSYTSTTFSDSSKIESYALKAVKALYEQNIISGSSGQLNPNGSITRAEFATMLNQLYTYNYFSSVTPVRYVGGYPLCWAACASMVGAYEVRYTPKTPEVIASHVKGNEFFYDVGGTLSDTIAGARYGSDNKKYFGCYSEETTPELAPELASVMKQIKASDPIICCGSALNSNGTIKGDHMIVLNGYSRSTVDRVVYCDPEYKTYREAILSDLLSGATTGYDWYYSIVED